MTAEDITLLSVLVPAYGEGTTIYGALGELMATLDALPHPHEVIVVSDGSTDDTAAEARRLGSPNITVLEYEQNRGKGYALRHGFAASRGSHIAFIDADMELHPRGVERLLRILRERQADAVVGSKIHPESKVFYPSFRRLQSRVYRVLVRRLFSLDIADTQTGLKVFRRAPLAEVMPTLRSDGFAFDLELLVEINDAGYSVVEGPVELDYRFKTTTGWSAVVDVLADTFALALRRYAGRRQSRRASRRQA